MWELAWVIFNIDHKINFKRNTDCFEYIWEQKKHIYCPDFYLSHEDEYVEIKGYYSEKAKAKIRQFPKKIKLLLFDDLKYIFEYVYSKYGKNIERLYSNK